MRPRRAVTQLEIALAEPTHPLPSRVDAATSSLGGPLKRPTLLEHTTANQEPTARTGPMISVQLHPVTSFGAGGFDTPSRQRGPDEQRA